MEPIKSVQTFGRKKTAVAVAYCKEVRKEERESERKKKCVCVCVCFEGEGVCEFCEGEGRGGEGKGSVCGSVSTDEMDVYMVVCACCMCVCVCVCVCMLLRIQGKGLIKLNGSPIMHVKPEELKLKVIEPVLLLGKDRYSTVDIRMRVQGGGKVAQIYALRQALAKALIAYHQKYVDEASKREIKDILLSYDRTLLVADPRRCEPKKFGGKGARSRFQKSYR